MENRNVGILVISLAIIMAIIVIIFNVSMTNIVEQTCTHGKTCSMYGTIKGQTFLSLSLVAVIFVVGLAIMFTKPKEKVVVKTRKVKQPKKKADKSKLDKQEKQIVEFLEKEKGGSFQKSLMEELNLGKVGMTRVLDKLESKQIIERKRRGMNNFIVLKNN